MPSTYTSSGHEELDILEERRQSGDLSHALRTFSPQPYKEKPPCSASDLSKRTLESQYLQYVFKEIATESSLSMEEVKEDARLLLEEMSQNLQLGFIRLMGYTLSKVFKRLYTNIYVNMEGLNMLQQAIQESPVILMPTHRSYIDFLIISYVLFTYDIPVPVIAAGLPLAGMKLVGEILRRSGAFFIRRSIGSDKLYWAVLSEYVKTIVRTGFAPLEFFVEGLRSRTLKSVPPKLGMMHMVLEPYFKGEVFDITLVPISISYDRVLEESLLAHELLGIPKPKETTKGLFKATKVLQEDYGCMHVNFGQPLSVRELCQGKINRSQYNLTPRDLPKVLSPDVQACVIWLAHLIVRIQEEGSYISPWSLMACVLLQCPTSTLTERGMVWSELKDRTLWLKKLALRFGAHLRWPEQVSDQNVLLSMVALHHSIVAHKGDRVCLVREEVPIRKHRLSAEEEVNRTAVAMLMLASYRNQSLHIFLRPAMLATVIQVTKSTQRDELFTFFCFLKEILSNEFIFVPGKSTQDFEEACFLMKDCGAILFSPEEVTVTEAGQEVVSFLCAFIQPFIRSYQVMLDFLTEHEIKNISEKELHLAVRSFVIKLILSGELQTYEALSSDIQKNILSALRTLGVLTKFRGSKDNEYQVDKAAVKRINDILYGKLPPQLLHRTPYAKL
ncbi:dihydroxyacetone phosphate acyltransferase [Periophthalmus magnuspinnatus]|uniref:dihydroxyacetone phosphate acyltransferase n=1 Tax=Periophthalmus magnuspinnatus TaxID=409849 RepID=UPI00145BB34E|nr:dihydroxyacetone phosphate acyltransferase [Periophthalmus magnuspinnatus]